MIGVSLMISSGVNVTCPAPIPKADQTTECNGGRQVCVAGVSV